jgi:hypothetical protein
MTSLAIHSSYRASTRTPRMQTSDSVYTPALARPPSHNSYATPCRAPTHLAAATADDEPPDRSQGADPLRMAPQSKSD